MIKKDLSPEKVKPNYNNKFDWSQDIHSIKLQVQIKNTTLKKIDILLSNFVLKINCQEKKFVRIFDFSKEINFKSKENSIVYVSNMLELTLVKQEQAMWDTLLSNLDKDKLKEQRIKSFEVREQYDKEQQEISQNLVYKYDSHATRSMMDYNTEQRQQLEKRKEVEHKQAQETLLAEGKHDESQTIYQRTFKFSWNDDQIVRNCDLNEIPIRKAEKIELKFTEKPIPTVALRDTHLKDQPFPQMGQQNQKSQKSALFLKEEGDQFAKNKDYYSAINMYSQAMKIDQGMYQIWANRSFVYLQLFNFQECINDCDRVIEIIDYKQSKIKEEKIKNSLTYEEPEIEKQAKIKALLRKIMALAWQGSLNQAKVVLESVGTDYYKDDVEKLKSLIEERLQLTIQKLKPDLLIQNKKYDQALELYMEMIQTNGKDERIYSNISLIYLLKQEYEKCIEFSDKALEIINERIQYTNFAPQFRQSSYESSKIQVKLYNRKCKSYIELEQYQIAQQQIKKSLFLDDSNQETIQLNNQIQNKLNTICIEQSKEQAKIEIQNKNYEKALQLYDDCLKKIEIQDTNLYLQLLLNRSVCYLQLQKYDDIIQNSLRGLKIIRTQKQRYIQFEKNKISKEDLQKYEIRFLIRRSKAYLELEQIYNAKADIKDALELEPENEELNLIMREIEQNT